MDSSAQYIEIENKFKNQFYNYLTPILKEFEPERKKRIGYIILTIVLTIIAAIVSCFYFAYYEFSGFVVVACVAVIAVIIKTFEKKIKNQVMPHIGKCFGDLTWLDCNNYIIEGLKESNLLAYYTSSFTDDVFVGSHNGVQFEIAESKHTKTSRDRDGKRVTETVFNGVIIRCAMNKNFTGNTIIVPDSLLHISPKFKLKRTTLEDVNFEKKYDVFTNDEVEARYLITTAFMERLNNIKVAFNTNNISCAFYGDSIYIGMSLRKNLFSIGALNKDICDFDQFYNMFKEILSIIKLIDYFKLDQQTRL